jgi:biopolymer transport protein ExbD
MRVPTTEPELGIPNMMPLIDVVFLLLIFFLMVGRFEQEDQKRQQEERELKVALPEVADAQPLAMTQELVVNITPEGKYVVLQREYSERQLAALLQKAGRNNPHQSVLIRGDARSAWRHGVRVMGLCNRAKIEKYRVAAIEEKQAPKE